MFHFRLNVDCLTQSYFVGSYQLTRYKFYVSCMVYGLYLLLKIFTLRLPIYIHNQQGSRHLQCCINEIAKVYSRAANVTEMLLKILIVKSINGITFADANH